MIATIFAAAPPHISLAPEVFFHLGPIPVTNSMLLGIFGYLAVIWLFFWLAKSIRTGSRNRFATGVMMIFETLLGTVEQVTGDKKLTRRLAPLAITMFFFIITNYWIELLPVVGPIKLDDVPLFRGFVADLNVTFALAIITMVTVQIYAIRQHGHFGNLGRYFRNPVKDPAGAFEGVLEVIAEFSRLIALSMRLFGNVFAGEVLLVMISFLTSYASALVLPFFMAFELFIGAIQAYVFFMLTIVFISLGRDSHGEEHQPEGVSEPKAKKLAATAK